MQEQITHHIHTNKYFLEIIHNLVTQKKKMVLMPKFNNYPAKTFEIQLSDDAGEDDSFLQRVGRYRTLRIAPETPAITLLKEEKPERKVMKDITNQSEYNRRETLSRDKLLNYGVRSWKSNYGQLEITIILDPHEQQLKLMVLQRGVQLKTAQTTFTLKSLTGKKSPLKDRQKSKEPLLIFFQAFTQSTDFNIRWKQNVFFVNHESLKPLKLEKISSISTKSSSATYSSPQLPPKIELFKHIFLTELLAHMICNQFGRYKLKKKKFRGGNEDIQYDDEELQQLRKWGHRFSEFRDHPFKCKKKEKSQSSLNQSDEDNYEDDDEGYESNEVEDYLPSDDSDQEELKNKKKQLQNQRLKGQKKTKLQKMAKKFQKVDEISNFTFISGKDKSKINQIRYCLHQMSRESDKTQGVIDFVNLIFKLYPKQALVRNQREKAKSKEKMSQFMNFFKVKRRAGSCFIEYTKESFFHKVLNIGLRVLKNPYQLTYLRVPFSHLFWSIKFLYHRHKRAIFDDSKKKNSKRSIFLYRGFEIASKQIKKIKKNIGGDIEIEGFLSTQLNKQIVSAFAVNAKMIIEVPILNLKGSYDNGFSLISHYSQHPSEQQVLVNAFNIFRILDFYSEFDPAKEMVVNIVHLEYGSIRPIEKKVQKSQKLLEAEYLWRVNLQEYKKAKNALEMNKEKMTQKGHQKLALLLPKAEKQLKHQKKRLKKWGKEEYRQVIKNLSQWEKEIIVSLSHQRMCLDKIDNYAELLFQSGEYRRAIVYCKRRMKQVEMDRAIGGSNWRNCKCLIYKEEIFLRILFKSCINLGRLADSLATGNKLKSFYISTDVQESDQRYYRLIYDMQYLARYMVGMEEERKKYKDDFLRIAEQEKLFHRREYQRLIEIQRLYFSQKDQFVQKQSFEGGNLRIQKKDKRKERQRKKKVKKLKKTLRDIEFYTSGKYSNHYLNELWKLIEILFFLKSPRQVLEEGRKYREIRKMIPQAEPRISTSAVFQRIFLSLSRSDKKELQQICQQLSYFIKSDIYNRRQFEVVRVCLYTCLIFKQFRAGALVVEKVMRAKVKCKIENLSMHHLIHEGYLLLLFNLSEREIKEKFIKWASAVCSQQQYKDKSLQHLFKVQKEYALSKKGLISERNKDYQENKLIKKSKIFFIFPKKLLRLEYSSVYFNDWICFEWNQDKGRFFPYHYPIHFFRSNTQHILVGIDKYLGRGELCLLIQYYKQLKNAQYNRLSAVNAKQYLRKVSTFSKLHLNDQHLSRIPQLLEFWPYQSKQIEKIQVDKIGIDLSRVIENTPHLRRDRKKKFIRTIIKNKENMRNTSWRKNLDQTKQEVQSFTTICAKYNHYLSSTSMKRQRISRKEKVL